MKEYPLNARLTYFRRSRRGVKPVIQREDKNNEDHLREKREKG